MLSPVHALALLGGLQQVQLLLVYQLGTSWGRVGGGGGGSCHRHASVALYSRGNDPEPVWTQITEEKSFAPAGGRTPICVSNIDRNTGFSKTFRGLPHFLLSFWDSSFK
jgi:hypothetical protein